MHRAVVIGLMFGIQGQSFLDVRKTKANRSTHNTESLSETSSMQMTTEEFNVSKINYVRCHDAMKPR